METSVSGRAFMVSISEEASTASSIPGIVSINGVVGHYGSLEIII